MASPRPWPYGDEDRPSGSARPLSPADLQASLAHLGNDPDQPLAGTGADRPVVAVRVRVSVGGRLGLRAVVAVAGCRVGRLEGLRFRPSPDAVAWRRGAAGERRTARLLSSLDRTTSGLVRVARGWIGWLVPAARWSAVSS